MQGLLKVDQQISTGKLIRQGYEDVAVYNNSLRLDEEETTLIQVKKTSITAKSFADNTDTVLNDMTKTFDKFKERLVYATNNVHSTTSYQALATELKALKNNLVGLANTSINGQYLLSGTALSSKPIDANGVYQGNGESLNAFVGSGVQYPQNIDGLSLFLGEDSDYKRQVTTNIKLINQTKLTQADNPGSYPIALADSIKDLTGNTTNSYFFISGRNSDGTAFKGKVELTPDAKMSDLTEKIKNLYNGRVDVSLNVQGQIELKDQALGSSQLQFQMFASNVDITDTTAGYDGKLDNAKLLNDMSLIVPPATKPAVQITQFTKSLFTTSNANANESMMGDVVKFVNDGSKLISNVSQVVKSTNSYANFSTKLEDVSSSSLAGRELNLDITTIAGVSEKWSIDFDATSSYPTVVGGSFSTRSADELVKQFQEISDGEFSINIDGSTQVITGVDFSAITSMDDIVDTLNGSNLGIYATVGLTSDNQITITNKGATPPSSMTGTTDPTAGGTYIGDLLKISTSYSAVNTTAVVASTQASLTGGTNANDSGFIASLVPTIGSFDITINNVASSIAYDFTGVLTSDDVIKALNDGFSGLDVTASLDENGHIVLTNETKGYKSKLSYASSSSIPDITASLGLTNTSTGVSIISQGKEFEVYNANGTKASSKDMTYKQLSDVVSMTTANVIPSDPSSFINYVSQTRSASTKIETTLNEKGQLTVKDQTGTPSVTKMSVSLYDPEVTDFSSTTGAALSFASNNAITIDDPKVGFFSLLDEAISAVEKGRTRPDGLSQNDPRNRGMQNIIASLDHLMDHVERQHTKNGAIANTLLAAQTRSETLILHTKTLKSSFMDTDLAEASLELSQLTTTYSAAMAALQKINGMSLVNYIK